jgi:hypothetical protein
MNCGNTFDLLGPLAAAIRELLFLEWNPCSSNHNSLSIDVYDDYIPAIHRMAVDRVSAEDIAAYLNFVVKNYIGQTPDKELNQERAAKIFAFAEAGRQMKPQYA